MSLTVFPYTPSMGVNHTLVREGMQNVYKDGYRAFGDAERSEYKADGTKNLSDYKGLNKFRISFNRTLKGADQLADQLWQYFLERLDNYNEPFYFYNPTERFPPDITGADLRGRYYVRLLDPGVALTREYFFNCLFKYGIDLIECREFERITVMEEEYSYLFEVPIELIDLHQSAYAGGYVTFRKTMFYYDTDDYNAVQQIHFEVVATNYHSPTVRLAIVCVDDSDPAYNNQECGDIYVPGNVDNKWLRTEFGATAGSNFEPFDGKHKYGIYFETNDISGVELHTARLIIVQYKPTKTRVQYSLVHSQETSINWLGTLPLIQSADLFSDHGTWGVAYTDWQQPTHDVYSRFKWVPERYEVPEVFGALADLTFTLEIVAEPIGGFLGGNVVEAALFDTTFGGDMSSDTPENMIAASRATVNAKYGWVVTDANADCAESEDFVAAETSNPGAAAIAPNRVYDIYWRCGYAHIFTPLIFKACLYMKLENLWEPDVDKERRFETYWRINRGDTSPGGAQSVNSRARLNYRDIQHETCGYALRDETSYVSLTNDNGRDSGMTPQGSMVIIPESRLKYKDVTDQRMIRRGNFFSLNEPTFVTASTGNHLDHRIISQLAVVTLAVETL